MEGIPGRNIESKDWQKFIPLSKYWLIRNGVLDLAHGFKDIENFLDKQDISELGGDVRALQRVVQTWNTGVPLDVGESGTLLRYLKFANWFLGLNKEFKLEGTLLERRISNDPDIINWDLKKLQTLDGGTTQWASAAILFRPLPEIEKELKDLKEIKYFLQMTLGAKKHWEEKRKEGKVWESRPDEILTKQAEYFLNIMNTKPATFSPTNPDDYCFARVFRLISTEEGKKRWPEASEHESNRFDEMEKVIAQASKGEPIDSKDHRVVQAMAIWGAVNKKKLTFTHPEAVNKTWPQFWEFLKTVS